MVLKISFETDGYELPIDSPPSSLESFQTMISQTILKNPFSLIIEYFDIENDKVTINDEFDYQYFIKSYERKKSLIFVHSAVSQTRLDESISVIEEKEKQHEICQKTQKGGLGILNWLDKVEVAAFSKVSDIFETVSNVQINIDANRRKTLNFRHQICLSCNMKSEKDKTYVCLICNNYILCHVCEAKIEHNHPMAVVRGSFDDDLNASMKSHTQILEAKTAKNHYCKLKILKSLIPEKINDIERRNLVWKYANLTNEEFLDKIAHIFK